MSAAVAVAVASAINATLVSKQCFIDPSSALLIEAAYCYPFKQKRYHNRGESLLPFCNMSCKMQREYIGFIWVFGAGSLGCLRFSEGIGAARRTLSQPALVHLR